MARIFVCGYEIVVVDTSGRWEVECATGVSFWLPDLGIISIHVSVLFLALQLLQISIELCRITESSK